MKKIKICFAASSGGHTEELSRLNILMNKYESFIVTEKSDYNILDWMKKKYYVNQINRKEFLFIPKFIKLFFDSCKILKIENPDIIISTGALATYPICLLGKLKRKKIVYIESFARVDSKSLTGKLMYKIADIFFVQWEEMLELYPNAVYVGGIF